MNKFFLITLIILSSLGVNHAQKDITLEDIWTNYTFYASGVRGFDFLNDGKSYTRLEKGKIQQYDFSSGDFVKTIFDANEVDGGINYSAYSFSGDEGKIMLTTASEKIYRYSTRDNFFVWDMKSKQLKAVFEDGKQMYADFNPQADKVAFVHDNDLYFKDLMTDKVTQITADGKYNHIINGASDWVYEEEFGLVRAFEWSPDGKKIAFLRFDESNVKEFTMQMYNDDLYPENVVFKYPKVGEKNSVVSAHIYNLENGKLVKIDTGSETDIYLPRIRWTPNGDLYVFRMNRHQNELELLMADINSGATKLLYKEKEDQYVAQSVLDDINFLSDGKYFVMASERDGWNHIYLHDMMTGKQVKQLTEGEWDVTSFYGVDEENKMAYFQAAKETAIRKHVYAVDWKGKQKQLSKEEGTNSANFSNTFDYYVLNHSSANTPPSYAIYDRKGIMVRELADNQRVADLQKEHGTSPVEFMEITTSENVKLNAWMIKPADFKENRQYPVFMYLYGGPGSQQVTDAWKGQNYWWFQMLAQQGFIVACVDIRGTGARGEELKKRSTRGAE